MNRINILNIMILIKEINGWKLYKQSDDNFRIETPEGFKQTYRPTFDEKQFDVIVERGWIWVDIEYYQASIKNFEIRIQKHKKQIQSNKSDALLQIYSIDEVELKENMKPILIKANEKFEKSKAAFEELQKEFGIDINYTMEGDTHGIYESHLNMTFRIDGVYCYYEL